MKILFFLLITVFFATIGFAEVSHQSDETNKKIEKIEEKLDTTKEELTKYTQITDDTKERVSDISGSVDRFTLILSVSIGLFGVLITGIVIFFSIRSTREAKLEAKEEAQKEAKKLLQEWIDKEAKAAFEAKVNALSNELQVKGEEILERIENKANEQHNRHEEDHQRLMLNPNPTQEEKDEVAKEAKQTEGKKEEELTFNDYWARIADKYILQEFQMVMDLIETAQKLINLNDVQKAQLIFAKGVTSGLLEKRDDEIKNYDKLLSTYKDSKIDEIIVLVVMSMVNKAVRLGERGKVDDELKIYDEVISIYKYSKINEVIEQVVTAMNNKGITLHQERKYGEAFKIYDELINFYKDSKIIPVQKLLVKAKVNKGITLGKLDKDDDEIKIYDEVISTYKNSKIDGIIEQVTMAMLNKGVTFGKQNKYDEAIKIYDELIFIYKDSKIDGVIKQVLSAIENKLELEIILDKPISDDKILLEKLNVTANDMTIIDMLLLLQNAKTSLQDAELHSWLEKYKDVKYSVWGFDELEKWIANATYSDEVKQRIRSYMETFKTHLHRA